MGNYKLGERVMNSHEKDIPIYNWIIGVSLREHLFSTKNMGNYKLGERVMNSHEKDIPIYNWIIGVSLREHLFSTKIN